MYAEDGFHTLTAGQQVGLVALALVLGALAVAGGWLLVRRAHWPTRLLGALGVFVVYEWLSPQVFYLYYLAVIDGLPAQWVIGWYPRPVAAAETLLFLDPPSLSAHARAVFGWALVASALVFGRFRPPIRHH